LNQFDGANISVFASSAIDRWFDPSPVKQTHIEFVFSVSPLISSKY